MYQEILMKNIMIRHKTIGTEPWALGLSLEIESSIVNMHGSHPENNEREFTGHSRIQYQEWEKRK
jgi:hypothetical protein